MRFYSGTGKDLGEVSLGATSAGLVSVILKRADLCRALTAEALRRGVRIEHSRRLVRATSDAGGVTAAFADGSQEHGDLLIGCDGLRSRVREIIDPRAAAARYVPLLNIGGYARDVSTSVRTGEYAMVFGKRAFFGWTVAPDGETWWFANPPAAAELAAGELESVPDATWREWLLALFAADRTPATDIIAATHSELRRWATYDVPRVPTWHNHSTTPSEMRRTPRHRRPARGLDGDRGLRRPRPVSARRAGNRRCLRGVRTPAPRPGRAGQIPHPLCWCAPSRPIVHFAVRTDAHSRGAWRSRADALALSERAVGASPAACSDSRAASTESGHCAH
jgi:hypothetical protein